MGTEAEEKSSHNSRRRCFKAAIWISAAILMACGVVAFKTNSISQSGKRVKFDVNKFSECTISFKPPKANSEWSTKPIWLPAYPTSLKESTHKIIIKQLTGLDQGGKSYYASAKGGLRFCFGATETATCSNVHPMVDMAGGPDKKKEKFYSEYIMAIRNPMTAIPAFINDKDIKYHGGKGQMMEEEWRKSRDVYLTHLIEEWKSFLAAWKKNSSYTTGMYLVYEDLYDLYKGPAVLERLSNILHAAHFTVAPKEDIPCIWFNAIGEDQLQQHHEKGYEYNDYIPGYTKAQHRLLLTAISSLIDEYREDKELVYILQGYKKTIAQYTRIDREYSNVTIVADQ